MTLRISTSELPDKRNDVMYLAENFCSFVEIQLSTGKVVPCKYIDLPHEGLLSDEEEAEFRKATNGLNLPW